MAEARRGRLGHRDGEARNDEKLGGSDLLDKAGEGGGVTGRVLVGDHGAGARHERSEEFGGAVDEARRALGDPHVVVVVRPRRRGPLQPVGKGAMGSDGPLGLSGTAGGVDDRGRVVRADLDAYRGCAPWGVRRRDKVGSWCGGSGRPSVMTTRGRASESM